MTAALLVHGYLGSPRELAPLEERLGAELGRASVRSVLLPGHGQGAEPPFLSRAFVLAVREAAESLPPGPLVLVGHSIGGSIALAAAETLARRPALLVLAGTPPRIGAGYAARFRRQGGGSADLAQLAELVRFVNGLSRRAAPWNGPLLVLQGEDDELVPAGEAELWRGRAAAVRILRIPGALHDLFHGQGGQLAVDVVARAVRDAERSLADPSWAARLPRLRESLARWPATLHHLREGPAGRRLDGCTPDFEEVARTEPTLLNLSVTTRCNLACPSCARTFTPLKPADVSEEAFARILEQVPHAARVVLVGLGEPLLHPQLPRLVRHAAASREVSLVTNGTLLTRELSRALLEAGLSGLTVSIDATTREALARVRPGTDLEEVRKNLGGFLVERAGAGLESRVGVAVFTALSAPTAGELEGIVAALLPLPVDAIMLSDLNFPENEARSLYRGLSREGAARLDRVLRQALLSGLPVLSVLGLEELSLPERFREFLLLRGARLSERRSRHAHCCSPWQTLPVGPDGEVTLCDCQPRVRLGNVLEEPFSAIWNGPAMRAHRRRMRSADPPPACRACPRF